MNSASVLVGSDLSARFLAEEFGDCLLRIGFNDQSFLLRSGFSFSALQFWLLCHVVLLSHRFSAWVKVMPQPGIGPGRREWARGCKPRLSASSSTGAYKKALNVGTVTPAETSPVPTLLGPISAALEPSSSWSSSKSLERNVFVRDRSRFPFVVHPSFFSFALDFSRIFETAQNLVNTGHWSAQARKVIAFLRKFFTNFRSRHSVGSSLQYHSYRSGNSKTGKVLDAIGNPCQWREMAQDFIKVSDLITNLDQVCFEVSAAIQQLISFPPEFRPCFSEIRRFHNYGG